MEAHAAGIVLPACQPCTDFQLCVDFGVNVSILIFIVQLRHGFPKTEKRIELK